MTSPDTTGASLRSSDDGGCNTTSTTATIHGSPGDSASAKNVIKKQEVEQVEQKATTSMPDDLSSSQEHQQHRHHHRHERSSNNQSSDTSGDRPTNESKQHDYYGLAERIVPGLSPTKLELTIPADNNSRLPAYGNPILRRVQEKEGPVALTVMKDQDGCRLLQHLLRVASDDLKQHIVALALPDFHKMMTDPLGNYFCQSALQVASDLQLATVTKQCQQLLPSMSKSLYGTRAVQKLIVKVCESADPLQEEMLDCLSKSFSGRICELAFDSYGSHVVRELLRSFPEAQLDSVHSEVRARVLEIATAKRGYSAVQKCLQTTSARLRKLMIEALLPYTQRLLLDPFGNFIAQCMLNLGDEAATAHVIEVVLLNLLEYTKHKFASNVVELCILKSNVYQLGSFIGGIVSIGIDGLISVLEDPFGNYVVQLLLELTPTTGFSPLPKLIQVCLPRLSLSPQGRRIAHIFNSKYPHLSQLPESYALWRDLRSSFDFEPTGAAGGGAWTSADEDAGDVGDDEGDPEDDIGLPDTSLSDGFAMQARPYPQQPQQQPQQILSHHQSGGRVRKRGAARANRPPPRHGGDDHYRSTSTGGRRRGGSIAAAASSSSTFGKQHHHHLSCDQTLTAATANGSLVNRRQ